MELLSSSRSSSVISQVPKGEASPPQRRRPVVGDPGHLGHPSSIVVLTSPGTWATRRGLEGAITLKGGLYCVFFQRNLHGLDGTLRVERSCSSEISQVSGPGHCLACLISGIRDAITEFRPCFPQRFGLASSQVICGSTLLGGMHYRLRGRIRATRIAG